MKVVFLKDVPRVGRRGEVKEVSEGYARNFLFPRKLGEAATSGKLAEMEKEKGEHQAHQEREEAKLEATLSSVRGKAVTIQASANEQGSLFKGIRTKEVAEALKKQLGVEIMPERLIMETIKHTGEFVIGIEGKGKETSFKLVVQS